MSNIDIAKKLQIKNPNAVSQRLFKIKQKIKNNNELKKIINSIVSII